MINNTCYNSSGCGSYQKWRIGNDVRSILLANSGITTQVGQNIFPLIAPENVKGDFIIYQRDKYSKQTTKMGVYEDDCQLVVVAVAESYDDALNLAELIDNTLTGKHIKDDGTRITIDLVDSTEAFEDLKYIETLLFKIK